MTEADHPDIRPVGAFLRLALISIAAAAVAVGGGYFPTRTLAGSPGVGALYLGVSIALGASLAGLIPPVVVLRQGPRARISGLLTGMAIRFILTLALLLAALLSSLAPKLALALWVAIGYLIMLAVDTAGMWWLTRRAARDRW